MIILPEMTMTEIPDKKLFIRVFCLLSVCLCAFAFALRYLNSLPKEMDISGYTESTALEYQIERIYYHKNNQLVIRGFAYDTQKAPLNPIISVLLLDTTTGEYFKLPSFFMSRPDVVAERGLEAAYSRCGFESNTPTRLLNVGQASYDVFLLYEDHDEKRLIKTGEGI